MRFYIIWMLFFFLSFYAFKDWFKACCILVASMAIMERPDFPASVAGIPGLNPWNLLFMSICAAFIAKYKFEARQAKLPSNIKFFVYYYLFFIVLGFLREIGDIEGITLYNAALGRPHLSAKDLVVDHLFNTLKYAIPGLLLFYGVYSRGEKGLYWVIAAISVKSFILAVLVIKVMPIGALTDGYTLEQTGIRKIDRDIGYYRSDLAILFAAAAWVVFSFKDMQQSKLLTMACMGASFIMALAMALTGGRIGMGAWIVVGAFMAYFRWRKLFFLGPIAIAFIISTVPAVQERFLQGLADEDGQIQEEKDLSSTTSGRTIIWPHVIEQIGEAPWFGHGREGMKRSGLALWLWENKREVFPHPHNAYLTLLLDNGIIISIPILLFFFLMFKYSYSLFRDKRNLLYIIAGSVGLCHLLANIIGFVGQQSFYPYTSSTSLWCSMGLVMAVHLARSQNTTNNHTEIFMHNK
jgi:O-antigen ligase